ncbi:transcriptional regulator with XRE-family HTH domain [Nitrobacter vulgaris]|nr:transcriptional regulator with XRE-family HTH domain [Nitrobacter vulgaris]
MTISACGIGKTVHSSDQAAFCALMVAARKQAGLTQHERARRLKRPQSFVAKYEGGEPTSHLLFIYYLEERPVGRLRLSLAHQNNNEAPAVPDGRQPVSAKSFPLNDLVDINGDDYFSLSVGNLDIVFRQTLRPRAKPPVRRTLQRSGQILGPEVARLHHPPAAYRLF